jgi:ribosomal protein S18 acetylase RimI-like enzyme
VVPFDSSSPEIIIRSATSADVPALGALGAELVRSHHDFDGKRFMAPTTHTAQGYASFLGSQLRNTETIILVAEHAGKVIGYTYSGIEGVDWMSLRGPAGVVHDIVVDRDFRGQGIGLRLLDATLREIEARGVPQVVLHTAALNAPAQRLFTRAGFRQTMVEMTREAEAP